MEFQFPLVLILLPILILTIIIPLSNGSDECHKDDLKGLELLKSGITYDSAGLMDSWHGPHCCQWKTIRCDDTTGRVTEILFYGYSPEIQNSQMNGSLSGDALALLSYLQVLDLGNLCGISGEIPAAIGHNLPNLTELSLFGNMFTGPVPESIGMLSKLTQLSLFDNQLSGSLPPSLGALKNLDILWLHSNRFSGSIPESFSNLTNLVQLTLANNSLSGKIPERIGDLTYLVTLSLNNNHLSGNIPESTGNLTSITNLYLSENNLTGRIPEGFLKMRDLSGLDLSYNQLVGEIPQDQPLIGFPPSAFEGNTGLCGKPLKPCN